MNNLELEILSGHVSDETLLAVEQQLNQDDFVRYSSMVMQNQKSVVAAWLLWFFLGTFQIHMIYLGLFDDTHLRILRIIGLVTLYFWIGWFILIPLWIYDAVKMNSYVKETNNMNKANLLLMYLKN